MPAGSGPVSARAIGVLPVVVMVSDAGLPMMVVSDAGEVIVVANPTVTPAAPVVPSRAAWTRVAPGPVPTTTPVPGATVATVGSSVLQVASALTSRVVPSVNVADAWNGVVAPTARVAVAGVTETAVATARVTSMSVAAADGLSLPSGMNAPVRW
jgi:hypothetical protein